MVVVQSVVPRFSLRRVDILNSKKEVSIIIPAYNEENAISTVVADLKAAMLQVDWTYEIIVVNDASKDQTALKAEATGAKVISHPANIGYGGALHTGINAASYAWIATIDADCSYPAIELLKLLPHAGRFDMVIGARQGKNYWGTLFKYPARLVFLMLAQFVVGYKIPDVNSGLRIFRKSVVVEMLPRLSRGFSFSTTITLSFLSSYRFVRFEPIEYLSRVGSSKVRYFRDTLRTLQLMFETIVYYNPVKAGIVLMLFPFALGAFSWIVSFDMEHQTQLGFSSARSCFVFPCCFSDWDFCCFCCPICLTRRFIPLEKKKPTRFTHRSHRSRFSVPRLDNSPLVCASLCCGRFLLFCGSMKNSQRAGMDFFNSSTVFQCSVGEIFLSHKRCDLKSLGLIVIIGRRAPSGCWLGKSLGAGT